MKNRAGSVASGKGKCENYSGTFSLKFIKNIEFTRRKASALHFGELGKLIIREKLI